MRRQITFFDFFGVFTTTGGESSVPGGIGGSESPLVIALADSFRFRSSESSSPLRAAACTPFIVVGDCREAVDDLLWSRKRNAKFAPCAKNE